MSDLTRQQNDHHPISILCKMRRRMHIFSVFLFLQRVKLAPLLILD